MILKNKNIFFVINYCLNSCQYIKGMLNHLLVENSILINCNRNKLYLYINNEFINYNISFINCKIIFVKYLPDIQFLIELKKNNILIHDIIDYFYSQNNIENYNKNLIKYFDKLIVNSNKMKEKFNINDITTIYHNYDNRIKSNNKIIDNVYYFGIKNKLQLSNKAINDNQIKLINFNRTVKYFNNAFSCIHICIYFTENELYYTYTSTKLATAIASNSIFICNKIPVFYELLGDDYEFYCNSEEELSEIILKAKNTINTKELFNDYLNKYNYLKHKLNINTLVNQYKNIFNL
tara:strand:- start:2900 stop:3778 length:879 start_codon:yes stop_codon:yes gene_type:complete